MYGLAIKQERGKVTYDALIDAGFKMLELRDLQDISIADLAREAGYSVGAFYARFRSKDEFFDALIAKHLEIRTDVQIRLLATLPLETLLEELIPNVVDYYRDHQRFWSAVLARSLRDALFWGTICDHGVEFAGRFTDRMAVEVGRPLSAVEVDNIFFAIRVLLSTINLALISKPECERMDEETFRADLIRTFRLVSGFDELIAHNNQLPNGIDLNGYA